MPEAVRQQKVCKKAKGKEEKGRGKRETKQEEKRRQRPQGQGEGRKRGRERERKKERKKKTGTPEAAAAYFSAGDRVGLVLSLRFMKWMNTAMLVRLFQDAPAKLTDLGITM